MNDDVTARCKCGKAAHVAFFHNQLQHFVNFCWSCYDIAKSYGHVGHN
jgi:hypothetical protein